MKKYGLKTENNGEEDFRIANCGGKTKKFLENATKMHENEYLCKNKVEIFKECVII